MDDLSDHFPCLIVAHKLKVRRKVPPVITCRKITPKTLAEIKTKLYSTDLMKLVTNGNVNEAFDNFHDTLLGIVDSVAPHETFVSNRYRYRKEPWLPVSLLRNIKKQILLYRKTLLRSASGSDRLKYKNYRNILTKLKRHCKCKYYQDKCNEFSSNTKALWKIINRISGKASNKKSVITCLKNDGIQYFDSKKIATLFNSHFASVGKQYAASIKKSRKEISSYLACLTRNQCSSYWYPVAVSEVCNLICKLPNKKSSGFDSLDNTLLKAIGDCIEKALCKLFNMSICEGIFPDKMKKAEVVPLHKGKSRTLCTNYRPISLLITLSKSLEKIVHKRTYDFLNNYHQIYDSQYGFRSKHSCEHAIQELLGYILKGYEQGKHTLAIFLDLSKAFDTISHQVLFHKLEIYGIQGICLEWFKSYLCDHTNQKISINLFHK